MLTVVIYAGVQGLIHVASPMPGRASPEGTLDVRAYVDEFIPIHRADWLFNFG